MFGALAGGVYASISETSGHMARESSESFTPDPAAHEVYSRLYAEYVRLHELFGRGGDQVLRELKGLQAQVLEA